MRPEVVKDFHMLFNLVCTNHTGPVIVDFGRQLQWDGIIAGQCTNYVQFLQARGLNAALDLRTNKIVFSEGNAEFLKELLDQAQAKEQHTMAERMRA